MKSLPGYSSVGSSNIDQGDPGLQSNNTTTHHTTPEQLTENLNTKIENYEL